MGGLQERICFIRVGTLDNPDNFPQVMADLMLEGQDTIPDAFRVEANF